MATSPRPRPRPRKKTPARPAPPRRRSVLRTALKWAGAAAVWIVILALAAGVWVSIGLPDLDEALKTERRPTVAILAADGAEIYRAGDLVGETVALKDLPPHLVQAVLATEDRRFYSHFGIDPIGLARAMTRNIRAGRIVEGGSTITQQLAKNLFLTPARTLVRKLQEMVVALWLEWEFSKDQILTLYLNRVYLGAGTYGVDAAAHRFFQKPASRINTYEGAVLAGLLKAPSRYNPVSSPERAHARARTVLANMVAAGYLTETKAAEAARGIQVAVVSAPTGNARHFVDWVLEAVSDYVTAGGRDLVVKTTLDLVLQRQAETAMGRAFLAAIPENERAYLMSAMAERAGPSWPAMARGVERAVKQVATQGFCTSFGEWQHDVNAVGVPIRSMDGATVMALNCGGPAFLHKPEKLEGEWGPRLVNVARTIEQEMQNGFAAQGLW